MAGRLSLLGAGRQTAPSSGGDWTPLSVSGCEGWWDFSDNTTVFKDSGVTAAGNDDKVVQLNDKSGNGRYWRQTTTARCGLYKTGAQNGLNAIYNNGATRAQTLNNPGGILKNVAGATIAIVASADSDAGTMGVMNVGINGASIYPRLGMKIIKGLPTMFVNNTDDNEYAMSMSTNTSIGTLTHATIVGTVDYANGAGWLYLNGSLDASNATLISGTATPGNTPDTDCPGGQYGRDYANYHTGYIDEMIIYNSILSTSDRQALESYLMTKWGIS